MAQPGPIGRPRTGSACPAVRVRSASSRRGSSTSPTPASTTPVPATRSSPRCPARRPPRPHDGPGSLRAYARGYKFSTYATWVIRNELSRTFRREGHRERLVPAHSVMCRDTVDDRADPGEERRAQEQREQVVARLLGRLDERERRVLVGRFG